jgi:hypothetical protein
MGASTIGHKEHRRGSGHYHVCLLCQRRIHRNSQVGQLAEGPIWEGYITPGWHAPGYHKRSVRGLWHEKCVESALQAHSEQERPYSCEVCGQALQHGTFAIYAVVGRYPGPEFIRPERRGYRLRLVAHAQCCGDEARRYFLEGKAAVTLKRAAAGERIRGWSRARDWARRLLRFRFGHK